MQANKVLLTEQTGLQQKLTALESDYETLQQVWCLRPWYWLMPCCCLYGFFRRNERLQQVAIAALRLLSNFQHCQAMLDRPSDY